MKVIINEVKIKENSGKDTAKRHLCMLCGSKKELREVRPKAFFCKSCINEFKKL